MNSNPVVATSATSRDVLHTITRNDVQRPVLLKFILEKAPALTAADDPATMPVVATKPPENTA